MEHLTAHGAVSWLAESSSHANPFSLEQHLVQISSIFVSPSSQDLPTMSYECMPSMQLQPPRKLLLLTMQVSLSATNISQAGKSSSELCYAYSAISYAYFARTMTLPTLMHALVKPEFSKFKTRATSSLFFSNSL